MTSYQLNYDELLFKQEDYNNKIRDLGQGSEMRSKVRQELVAGNADLQEECNQLRQQNSRLELQLCEQNCLLNEFQLKIKELEVSKEQGSDLFYQALKNIHEYLNSRQSVDDLTRSIMDENGRLKEENDRLKSEMKLLENQLLGYEQRLTKFDSIHKNYLNYQRSSEQAKQAVSDLYVDFQNQLNHLIAARTKALAESIASSPTDTLVRKNKALEEEVENLAHQNLKLRSDIGELKMQLDKACTRLQELEKEVTQINKDR